MVAPQVPQPRDQPRDILGGIVLAVTLLAVAGLVGLVIFSQRAHTTGTRGTTTTPAVEAPSARPPDIWGYFDVAVDPGTTASVVYNNRQSGIQTRAVTGAWHAAESFTRSAQGLVGRIAFTVISDGPCGVRCQLAVDGYPTVTASASRVGDMAVCTRTFW